MGFYVCGFVLNDPSVDPNKTRLARNDEAICVWELQRDLL